MLKLFIRFIAPNNVVYTNGYNIKDCWKVDINQVYRLVSDLGITIKNGFSKDNCHWKFILLFDIWEFRHYILEVDIMCDIWEFSLILEVIYIRS